MKLLLTPILMLVFSLNSYGKSSSQEKQSPEIFHPKIKQIVQALAGKKTIGDWIENTKDSKEKAFHRTYWGKYSKTAIPDLSFFKNSVMASQDGKTILFRLQIGSKDQVWLDGKNITPQKGEARQQWLKNHFPSLFSRYSFFSPLIPEAQAAQPDAAMAAAVANIAAWPQSNPDNSPFLMTLMDHIWERDLDFSCQGTNPIKVESNIEYEKKLSQGYFSGNLPFSLEVNPADLGKAQKVDFHRKRSFRRDGRDWENPNFGFSLTFESNALDQMDITKLDIKNDGLGTNKSSENPKDFLVYVANALANYEVPPIFTPSRFKMQKSAEVTRLYNLCTQASGYDRYRCGTSLGRLRKEPNSENGAKFQNCLFNKSAGLHLQPDIKPRLRLLKEQLGLYSSSIGQFSYYEGADINQQESVSLKKVSIPWGPVSKRTNPEEPGESMRLLNQVFDNSKLGIERFTNDPNVQCLRQWRRFPVNAPDCATDNARGEVDRELASLIVDISTRLSGNAPDFKPMPSFLQSPPTNDPCFMDGLKDSTLVKNQKFMDNMYIFRSKRSARPLAFNLKEASIITHKALEIANAGRFCCSNEVCQKLNEERQLRGGDFKPSERKPWETQD